MDGALALFAWGVKITVYMLPAMVASYRKHPMTTPITWLTLLLGWTVVGWLVAMVWAAKPLHRAAS